MADTATQGQPVPETKVSAPVGGEAQGQTPATPPASPSNEASRILSPADVLFELEKRGFNTSSEALSYIKRYDNVIAESRLEMLKLDEKKNELVTQEARLGKREADIKVQAEKLIAQRKDIDIRLEEANKKFDLLSKLGQ